MANYTRRWIANDIETLRRLAGVRPAAEIATQLRRTQGSLAVKAHDLKISLRIKDTDAARPSAAESQSP
jgi:hypothetical protein